VGKNYLQKKKKFKNLIFLSAGCSPLRAEGFSCLDVLHGRLGINETDLVPRNESNPRTGVPEKTQKHQISDMWWLDGL
jgi:hypothetical protein